MDSCELTHERRDPHTLSSANTAVSSSTGQENRRAKTVVFIAFALGQILVNYDSGAIPSVLPIIQEEFDFTPLELGILGCVPYIGLIVASPLVGRYIQATSQKCFLVISVFWNSGAAFLLSMSFRPWLLILSRFLLGITQSGLCIYLPVWVDEFAPESRLTLWMGLVQGCTVMGVMLGYLAAGLSASAGIQWRCAIIVQACALLILDFFLFITPQKYIDLTIVPDDSLHTSPQSNIKPMVRSKSEVEKVKEEGVFVPCPSRKTQGSTYTSNDVQCAITVCTSCPPPEPSEDVQLYMPQMARRTNRKLMHLRQLYQLYRPAAPFHIVESKVLPPLEDDVRVPNIVNSRSIMCLEDDDCNDSKFQSASCPTSPLTQQLSVSTLRYRPSPSHRSTLNSTTTPNISSEWISSVPFYPAIGEASKTTRKEDEEARSRFLHSSFLPSRRAPPLMTPSPAGAVLEVFELLALHDDPLVIRSRPDEPQEEDKNEDNAAIHSQESPSHCPLAISVPTTDVGAEEENRMRTSVSPLALRIQSSVSEQSTFFLRGGKNVSSTAQNNRSENVDTKKHSSSRRRLGTRAQCLKLLRNPIYLWIVVALCALLYVVTGVQFWATAYFSTITTIAPQIILIVFATTAATAPTTGVLAGGGLIDYMGGYRTTPSMLRTLMICSGAAIVATIAGILAGFLTNFPAIIVCIWLLLFFGGALLPPTTGILIAAVDPRTRAFASGLSMLTYNLFGYALGSFLPGVFMQCFGIQHGMKFVFCWAIFGVFGIGMATISSYRKHVEASEVHVKTCIF